MSKVPFVLVQDWPGDFSCPYCKADLSWADDCLYSHTLEWVKCNACGRDFHVKQVVKVTYEVVKTLGEKP
jgi:transcription elongation factor Elf1